MQDNAPTNGAPGQGGTILLGSQNTLVPKLKLELGFSEWQREGRQPSMLSYPKVVVLGLWGPPLMSQKRMQGLDVQTFLGTQGTSPLPSPWQVTT